MVRANLRYTKFDTQHWSIWYDSGDGNRIYIGKFLANDEGRWTILMAENSGVELSTYHKLQLDNALERVQNGQNPMVLG